MKRQRSSERKSCAMQLKVSSVLALAAAQTGQALMMSRAGTPSMRATAEDSAKRAWLNANEPSWRHRVQSARDAPMTAEAHRGADPSVAMAAQQVKQLRTEEATPSVGPNMMPSLRLDNRPNSRRARLEAKAQNVNVPACALPRHGEWAGAAERAAAHLHPRRAAEGPGRACAIDLTEEAEDPDPERDGRPDGTASFHRQVLLGRCTRRTRSTTARSGDRGGVRQDRAELGVAAAEPKPKEHEPQQAGGLPPRPPPACTSEEHLPCVPTAVSCDNRWALCANELSVHAPSTRARLSSGLRGSHASCTPVCVWSHACVWCWSPCCVSVGGSERSTLSLSPRLAFDGNGRLAAVHNSETQRGACVPCVVC